MVKKKENSTNTRAKSRSPDDLSDILKIKKQVAVANEFDNLIADQEEVKKARLMGKKGLKSKSVHKEPDIFDKFLASNPEALKGMSLEDIMKYKTLMGGHTPDPNFMMMQGLFGQKQQPQNDPMNTIFQEIILDVWKGRQNQENGNSSQGNRTNDLILAIVGQMMQMQMKNQSSNENNFRQDTPQRDTYQEKLLDLVTKQKDFENSFLRDKLREIEMRTVQTDPLGEAKRMIDYVKTFGSLFGGGSTPEAMKHEIALKKLDYEITEKQKEAEDKQARMGQIGEMVNKTVENLGKIFSEPIGNVMKDKINEFSKNPQQSPNYEQTTPPDLLKFDDIPPLNSPPVENFNPATFSSEPATYSDLDTNSKPPVLKKDRFRIYKSD